MERKHTLNVVGVMYCTKYMHWYARATGTVHTFTSNTSTNVQNGTPAEVYGHVGAPADYTLFWI